MKNKSRTPSNRELRTRKDLLRAAAHLLQQGRKPTMDEVAKEALVSRPTAYRYFHSVDHLLAESAVDVVMPDPETFFDSLGTEDPSERADAVEAAIHRVMHDNEASMRIQLASAIQQPGDAEAPLRQNRREPLIAAALAPAREQLSKAEFTRLCRALAFFMGPESMIVASDVLRIDPASARRMKSWAIRTLVAAALAAKSESGAR